MDLKMYHVDTKEKDTAKVIIRFLNCPYLYYREVSILNRECRYNPVIDPEYVVPRNIFYSTYCDEEIPTEEKLMEDLSKNEFAFNAVAALDDMDEDRITIMCLGNDEESIHKKLPFCRDRFIVTLSNPSTSPKKIHKIIKYLEEG